MINEKEIESMLYLLDDSDDRVVEHIAEKLFALGPAIIPYLEKTWPDETNVRRQEHIIDIIKNISQKALALKLENWKNSEHKDLLEGMLIINQIIDPNIDPQVIDNKLDKLKLDAWLELNYDLTSFEKIKILNHIIFDVHKYRGDTDNYHHSQNSFLSTVLERKKGNPVSLAIIYSIVAQRLNIPVYGVNLPQHFILGYVNDFEWPLLQKFNDESTLGENAGSDIMFYINPFNNGLIFSKENINKFLKQLNLEPHEDYYKTCTNQSILLRVLKNLEVSFEKEGNINKLEQVKYLMEVLVSEA